MPLFAAAVRIVLTIALGVAVLQPALAQTAPIAMASHRAVYDLKLMTGQKLRSVSGHIFYDFTGDDCEGYPAQFHQIMETTSSEGKVAVSDVHSAVWEDGAARRLRFRSQTYVDEKLIDSINGEAECAQDSVSLELTDQRRRSSNFRPTLYFRRSTFAASLPQLRKAERCCVSQRTLSQIPVSIVYW